MTRKLLWKRDSSDDADAPLLFDDIMRKADTSDSLRGDREENSGDKLTAQLTAMTDAMVKVDPSKSAEQHLFDLLHTRYGRSLAVHLSGLAKKESPMPQVDIYKLNNIDSVRTIAKHIIDHGASGISEHEFTRMVTGHAELARRAGENKFAAFTRIVSEDPDIRKALGIVKGYPDLMSLEPVQVGGNDALSTDVVDSSYKAAAQLAALVENMRARAPTLTTSQLYDRVYADPANRKLKLMAHRVADWHSAATPT